MRQQLIEVVQGLNSLRVDWEEGDQRQRHFETRVDQQLQYMQEADQRQRQFEERVQIEHQYMRGQFHYFNEAEQRRIQFEEEMREYMRRMAPGAGYPGAGHSGAGQDQAADDDDDQAGGQD